MALLRLCVNGGEDLGCASGRGNLQKAGCEPRSEDDGVIGGPGGAAVDRRVTEHDGRPARQRDFLELAAGEEADPLAIGRKERSTGVFSALDGLELELVHGPKIKPAVAAFLADIDEVCAVARERDRVGSRRTRQFREREGEANRWLSLRPRAP